MARRKNQKTQILEHQDGTKVTVPDREQATGHFKENGCKVFLYLMQQPLQFIVQRVDSTNPLTALLAERIPVWKGAIQLALNGCVVPAELRPNLGGHFEFDENGRAILPRPDMRNIT